MRWGGGRVGRLMALTAIKWDFAARRDTSGTESYSF